MPFADWKFGKEIENFLIHSGNFPAFQSDSDQQGNDAFGHGEDVKLMFSGKTVVIRFQFAPAIMADDQSGEIRIVCFDDFVESGQFFRIHILPLFLVYFLTG